MADRFYSPVAILAVRFMTDGEPILEAVPALPTIEEAVRMRSPPTDIMQSTCHNSVKIAYQITG